MSLHASDLEQIARDWQRAFSEAHGKIAPPVVWEWGWFRIGANRYRRKKLQEMTEVLRKGFDD